MHTVDLFASAANTHCPRFFYAFPTSPGCAAINVLAQEWSTGNLYANPSFSQIEQVLAKVVAKSATVTLVVPVWKSQPWWSEAVGRAHAAFLLPHSAGLFQPGRSQRPTPTPHWRAAALRFASGGRPWPPPSVPTSAPQWRVLPAATALPPLP